MSTTLKLSLDEYEQMIANGAFVGIERRIELIDGELREMSPAGPIHFDYIDWLTEWSYTNLPRHIARIQVQSALKIGNHLPEPDLMWLKPERYGVRRPTASDVYLLIEVADSSLKFDLGQKMQLYAAGGVPEYWVVNIPDQQIHVHRQPSGEAYDETFVVTKEGTLSPTFKPDCVLDLSELFVA